MLTSVLLAKLFGFILVIVTGALLLNRKNFDGVLKMYEGTMPMLVKGVINTLLGIGLLLYHSSWMTNLDISTTLFSWLILIIGLVNLFFPKSMNGFVKNIRKNKGLGMFALVAFLFIGIYFLYAGFTY
ncbi:MAG: hypothetical protein ABSE04_00515 [Candidatus Microgenomates bacterium]|jgi:hypothetical protein